MIVGSKSETRGTIVQIESLGHETGDLTGQKAIGKFPSLLQSLVHRSHWETSSSHGGCRDCGSGSADHVNRHDRVVAKIAFFLARETINNNAHCSPPF